ncbi:YSIRK-type signal peptide-containing protein, partial [Streptococcus parasanguinis]
MKDIFNRRQRFSLRKYSVGVCSVLLGTALFVAGAPSASAEEVTATPESSTETAATETAATETASSTEVATETTTTESSNYEAPAALVATSEPVTTASSEKAEATTETSKASEEEKKTEEASKEEKKTEDKKSEDKKSEDKKSEDKKSSTEAKTEKATTSATSEANTEATSSSEATEAETTSLAANPAVQPLNASANKPVADSAATTSATTLSAASTETATAGALETSRSRRRGRRAATDHNTEPVTTASTLNPNTEATPDMTNPNGATVHSQTIPTGYEAVSGDKYTYGIIDLSRYNTRYNKNYYIRVSKDFDQNVSSVVELVDKTTNTVLETHTVTAGSGRQVFTKTAEGSKTANASGGELTLYVTYDAGKGKGPGKTDQPFLQWDWIVDPTIESYQHASGNTPADQAKKKLFTDVTDSRTITDIFNAVEPASNGRTITNTNRIIPAMVDNSTFYKVVDKNSAEYKANPNKSKADREKSAIQNYKETGNEESLATYTVTGMEGQDFTSSGVRHFKDYRLYQPAEPNGTSGALSRRFKVGDKFMDADAYGIKRIKEVVKEDGSVVIRVYLLDPKQQSKRSNGTLDTDGYMLIAETEPVAPGQNNTKPLVTHMTPLNTIAFTGSDGVSHPNGIPVDFKFQDAAGYTPYKTVFVPFLGDGIGHWSANSQLVNGVKGIGTNVDLMNTLTPFTPAVYYYDKIPPIDVELKVTKALTDPTNKRTLKAGDFTFNIKNADSTTPAIDEDVTNKADGSVIFKTQKVVKEDGTVAQAPITLDKEGVYKYIITEKAGTDSEVDYDGMRVTATVTVKEKKDASGYLGEYEYTVTYTSTDGQDSNGQPNNSSVASNDTEFNNFVVAPVNVEFDFTKKLSGRKLQANEFTFNLLDESGAVIGTATNDAAGNVKFTGIKYTVNDLGKDASGKRNDSKTFNYTVKEVQGSLANVTYDQMEAKVTVTVTKPETGHTLAAVSTISSTGGVDADGNSTTGTPDTEFNNKYTPSPVKVNLDFDKSLSNGTLNAGDFSFTLTANTAGDTNTDQRVTNKANGKINFSVLSFDKVGVYNYTVKEVKGNVADVDYDAMTIDVTVTVTKDADTGLLSATTAMTSSGGEATDANDRIFNNHVVAPVTAQFDFSKVLAGRQLTAGEFSFELVDPSDTSTDPNGKVLQTKTNDANGLVKFDALTFKNGQEGTHKYIVREVQGSLTGVTYDTMKAEVTVTVTKSGHALTAVTTLPTDTVFNNTYTPSPASAQFRFTKKLEGKTLQGDDFEFELLENGNVIQTKKNVADGSITFDAISYATEGVHTYTVREKAGNDTNIDYDAMNATVTVTVTKDATTGLLNAAVTLPTDTEFNNYVVPPVPVNVNFTKALAGRALVAGEFTFEMKDENGVVVATGTNDEHGVVTFNQLPEVTNAQVGKVIKYTVSEKVPANKEFGVTYDNMVAEVSVSVVKNATSHALQAVVTYPGGDTEFNNTVTPPTTPDFQPEKFIVNKEKYDITGTKLMDDDDELADEYTDTNANPYADGTANNEPENLNTKTVKKGDKIVYQVWLDTTNLKASDNIQAVGISDKYEADKLEINVADIKAYDSVTGVDVTDKFDITVNNGVITATSKASFIKDINNDPVIDTTKFAFGRYYKFDIPATVKMTTPNGVDIENTANQIVHQYDPTNRNITKPEKPTQKRVVNLPVPLEFDFTKKLDGRNLVENEFTFVLK